MSDTDNSPDSGALNRETMGRLARGPFGRYAAGEAVSMVGTWMQGMAQSWVMLGLTSTPSDFGWLQAIASLPMLALTMYGGTVADKHDKRLIIILTQIVQIVLAVVVGTLVLYHRIQIWHLMTASVLLGISASFEMPASAALVPEMVAREDIAAAVNVDRAIFHGARLIGPALAGVAIASLGQASAFYANALSFFGIIVALATIKSRPRGSEEEEQQRTSGMKAGIDFVRQDQATLAMLGLMAASALCVFPFMAVLMPLYAKDYLHLDVRYTALLVSATGIGSLVAAVGLLSVSRSRRVFWMSVAAVDIVLALYGLSAARTFLQAVVALVMLAVGTSLNYGLANTTVQERAPGPLRGRISALAMMSFVGVMPFAAIGVTQLATLSGIRVTMAASALAYGAAALYLFTGPARHCSQLPAGRTAAVPVEV